MCAGLPAIVPDGELSVEGSAGGESVISRLLFLIRRARQADTAAELGFIAANETRLLTTYRQAALWIEGQGVVTLSGVSALEANAPYVQWLGRLFAELSRRPAGADFPAATLTADDLSPEVAGEWRDWLPAHALWLRFPAPGGLLLARDESWTAEEHGLLAEWAEAWWASWALRHKPTAWQRIAAALDAIRSWRPATTLDDWQSLVRRGGWAALWRRRSLRGALLLLVVLSFPVRLTVLAPGELVPAAPAAIRAPLEGIIDQVLVQPNQRVKAGDVLFAFDRVAIAGRLAVAEQTRATVEAEYRQAAQQALFDPKSKAQLALVQGRLAEKDAEVNHLRELDERARVVSPRDGIVMFGDVTEWVGRPVTTGERVMVVSGETESEVEAWLSPADMIDLPPDADVTLYLDVTPFSPVKATLRHVAHVARQQPDGHFAYRLRAAINAGETPRRVGLKGSAKVAGHRVPLVYWVLRKPWAVLRQFVGV